MKKIGVILAFFIVICLQINAQTVPVIKITELDKRLKNSGDTLMIVNFWATWCVPCVQEIPDFLKIDSLYFVKGEKLILVNLNDISELSEVAAFKTDRNIKAEITLLDEGNANYWIPFIDEKWEGAIPVTLFWNQKRELRTFIPKKMHFEEIEAQVKKMLE